jgi:hypothetical protein
MAALTAFAGDGQFWSLLDCEYKQKYSSMCSNGQEDELFLLEAWTTHPDIVAAVEEFDKEIKAEKAHPSNRQYPC